MRKHNSPPPEIPGMRDRNLEGRDLSSTAVALTEVPKWLFSGANVMSLRQENQVTIANGESLRQGHSACRRFRNPK